MISRRLFLVTLSLVCPALLTALTFSEWQTATFTSGQLADPAISGAVADPDSDGAANLHEYVFFGQPLTIDTHLSPVLSQAAGHLVLTYRERHAMTDVSIRLQGSNTLTNWITYNSVTEADRETFTGYDEVTLIDPQPFTQARRFLRLRVTLLPLNEPLAPTQLALAVVTPTAWSISWTDPNTTETGYAVERLLPTSEWERLATLGADIGTWQHPMADYQTSMTYRVVALGADATEATTEPITLPDADGDGLPNALELGAAYTGQTGTYASNPHLFSSNGTGISDGWLAGYGLNPAAGSSTTDSDGDLLYDVDEYLAGTSPIDPDSDDDNLNDASEVAGKRNPTGVDPPQHVIIALLENTLPIGVTADGQIGLQRLMGPRAAFRWVAGEVIPLSLPPGFPEVDAQGSSRAAINSQGGIAMNRGNLNEIIVVWPSGETQGRRLASVGTEISTLISYNSQNRAWGLIGHGGTHTENRVVWGPPNYTPTLQAEGTFHFAENDAGESISARVAPGGGSALYYVKGVQVDFAPLAINASGWVLGRQGMDNILYKDGVVLPLPAGDIGNLDDDFNLYQWDEYTHQVWTMDTATYKSSPTNGVYKIVEYVPAIMPAGWSSSHKVLPGSTALQVGLGMYLNPQGPPGPPKLTSFLMVPAELAVDRNRDGNIRLMREGYVAALDDTTTADQPFRFWSNDDDDDDDDDNESDAIDGAVNGANDLKDFFPVFLDIKQLLNVLPATTPGVVYKLKQSDGAVNFVYTSLTRATAFQYRTDGDSSTGYGPGASLSAASATTHNITAAGFELSSYFLDRVKNQDQGVILLEIRSETTSPLVLTVEKGASVIASITLNLSSYKIQAQQTGLGPQGSAPKYDNAPEHGIASNLFSVWPNEEIVFNVTLPAPQNLTPGLIKWTVPNHTIADNSLTAPMSWPLSLTESNTKVIKVKIGGAEHTIHVRVQGVGYVSQVEATALVPNAAAAALFYRQESIDFGAIFPAGPQQDAMRHSYWNSVSVSTFGVTAGDILFFTTAHENTNRYNDAQQAFNSTMDIENNAVGASVNHQVDGLPDRTAIVTELIQRYNAGEMVIWEVPIGAPSPSEGDSEGILIKSDGTRIFP